jgi:hypothetical protein
MDLFGMYGSRSDDEPNSAPEPVDAVAVKELPDEVSALDADTVTEPIVPPSSASEDAVRHFVAAMDGVEYDGQIVRPYARTGGRTRSTIALELETLLTLNTRDVPAHLSSEHDAICRLCRQTMSVAEVAAYQALPIGAARVLISDMVELGLIAATTTSPDPSGPTVDLMHRILEGLHRL